MPKIKKKKPKSINVLKFSFTETLTEGHSFCNLYFQVSPIRDPSCEAYFKAAYSNCKLKFACNRVHKN